MALVVDNATLAQAALAVHDVLQRNSLSHVFLGGFELVLLGNTRGTKDIDVEVAKPFIRGFQRVRDAFEADEAFLVFNGTTEEGVCISLPYQPWMLLQTCCPRSVQYGVERLEWTSSCAAGTAFLDLL